MLGSHCCTGFSLVAKSRGYSLVAACGHLIVVAFLVAEHRLPCAPASVVGGTRSQQLGSMGLVSLWHVGSSQTKNQTLVSHLSRWLLYYWVTREAQVIIFLLVQGLASLLMAAEWSGWWLLKVGVVLFWQFLKIRQERLLHGLTLPFTNDLSVAVMLLDSILPTVKLCAKLEAIFSEPCFIN